MYRPVIRFTTETGEEFEFVSASGSNPPAYATGERVTVLYLADDPDRASIEGFFSLWGVAAIFGGIGAVFLLVGSGIFVMCALKSRKGAYLKRHGVPVEAEFQSVELNEAFSVNGRHPFRILSQWQNPATSEMHVFVSDDAWFDPSKFLAGQPIRVFVDKNDPRKYQVDLSFLPKLAD